MPGAQLRRRMTSVSSRPLRTSTALHRRLVEVGVALHRAHDLADPLAGHRHLAEQRIDLGRGRQPHAAVARRFRIHAGEGAAQLIHAPAGIDQGGGLLGIADQLQQLVHGIGACQRRRWGPGPPVGLDAQQVVGRMELVALCHRLPQQMHRPPDAAAAGLFSSCARPAASVPSPASFSRWRTNSSSERSRSSTVRTSAQRRIGAGVQQCQQALPRDAQHLDVGDGPDRCLPLGPPCSAAISPWMAPGPTRRPRLLGSRPRAA